MSKSGDSYIIRPNPLDPRLTERVAGVDQTGARIETSVTVERALTIFLNSQEIVTAMTINIFQPVDPFFNVNTPEDAARAERIALQQAGA